jgi:anaerobic selenocysteine-containing dehydrogenase
MNDLEKRIRSKIPGEDTGIEVKKSICTICDPESLCGLDLYVKDGKIIKVEGSKEHPQSGGTLCSKGAATRQYVYHKDRVKTPLKRVGPRGSGEFESISWDEALDTIASKFNRVKADYGPESVTFYSGYSFNYRNFLQRLALQFGSPNYITNTSVCHLSMIVSQILTLGMPTGPDVRNAKCLLIWGNNPFHSQTYHARGLLDAKENGVKFIVVDPRYSPTAAKADIHLQLRPGTDGALALAMGNVMINEGLYEEDFIREHGHGFDAYVAYVQEFTPERGEELTGVPAEKIKAAARLYATTKPAALVPGSSPVTHHTNGLQNHRAIWLLVALTGNYDITGGNVVEPLSYLYMPGGFMTREEAFKLPRALDELPPRIGDDQFPVWKTFSADANGVHLPFQIRSEKPYPIKAMLAIGINYQSWPDPDFMAESLEKLDFIAIQDIFMTDSCKKFADIILPACTSVEISEFRCWPQRSVILTKPAIKPLYEARSNVDMLLDLAKRLGIEDPLLDSGFEACLDWILEPSGMTVEELKKHPGVMPVPNPITFPEKKYLKDGFMTPSKKVEFTASILEMFSESHGYDALPVYRPDKYSPEGAPEMAKDYPFILCTGSRLPTLLGSQTYRLPWTRSLRPDPSADINPEDAQRLGIAQGDDIKISTPNGEIEVKANLTNIGAPGAVYMSPSYINVNVGGLIESDYYDPIIGFPGYKGLLCNVVKA